MVKYYAKLNENEICTEIVSTKKDLEGIRGFIELENYNESVLYRKWLGDQWSQEKYEPSLESKIQDDIQKLKEENKQLKESINNKDNRIEELLSQVLVMSDSMEELINLVVGGNK